MVCRRVGGEQRGALFATRAEPDWPDDQLPRSSALRWAVLMLIIWPSWLCVWGGQLAVGRVEVAWKRAGRKAQLDCKAWTDLCWHASRALCLQFHSLKTYVCPLAFMTTAPHDQR